MRLTLLHASSVLRPVFFSALRPRVDIDRGRHNPCNRQRPVQLYLTIGCTAEVLPGRFNDIQLNLALTTG